MKIDQTITFKDALNVATQLLNSSDILQKNVEDTLQEAIAKNIDINYQAAFILCELAEAIYQEYLKRAKELT
nr:hypothetical protein [uncultured Acinetobacter sp.]